MADLRKEIIEAGYKALMRKEHPDNFPADKRDRQDEICKQLAVARDSALAALQVPRYPAPAPQSTHYRNTPMPPPISFDELIFGIANGIKKTFFPSPRKRKTKARRQA